MLKYLLNKILFSLTLILKEMSSAISLSFKKTTQTNKTHNHKFLLTMCEVVNRKKFTYIQAKYSNKISLEIYDIPMKEKT